MSTSWALATHGFIILLPCSAYRYLHGPPRWRMPRGWLRFLPGPLVSIISERDQSACRVRCESSTPLHSTSIVTGAGEVVACYLPGRRVLSSRSPRAIVPVAACCRPGRRHGHTIMVLNDLGRSINRALGTLLQREASIDEKVSVRHHSPTDSRPGPR